MDYDLDIEARFALYQERMQRRERQKAVSRQLSQILLKSIGIVGICALTIVAWSHGGK
ncbi:MAG: hypothetical protein JSS20_12570 [Proteobacteria bacterium]|nr:hypothetical protein [Pseudomonadota bacterium]